MWVGGPDPVEPDRPRFSGRHDNPLFRMDLHMKRGAGNTLAAGRRQALFAVLVLFAALAFPGCDPATARHGRSGFQLEQFNCDGIRDVPLNASLVFTFSAEVNPLTVNSDTIRIWTTLPGGRLEAEGSFLVSGGTVTWFPRMTSLTCPADPDRSGPVLPGDAGLNTRGTGLTYQVVVPSLPDPNTVRSKARDEPIRKAFVSEFQTAAVASSPGHRDPAGLEALFSDTVPFFRKTLRVADVLAYGDAGGQGQEFRDWILNPGITANENPLYLNPAILARARSGWRNRESTGEWVDQVFGIQLVPRLNSHEMEGNALPPGVSLRDERLISNLHGARTGRNKVVTGLHLYFTQAVSPDAFLNPDNTPRAWNNSPVRIQVLSSPAGDPVPVLVRPEPFTLTFLNNPDLHAGQVTLTFMKPIRQGWIRITLDPAAVKGMPGGNLEENAGGEFVYLWPVMVNAM